MTLTQALTTASALGLDRLDAQLLLLQALGRDDGNRAWLLTHDCDLLAPVNEAVFLALARRRAAGEPLAYLTGHKEFYGLNLRVDARVLVPRPDTETLVDWTLELLRDVRLAHVIDLGTGSGAIALALKHTRPDWTLTALDASPAALEVAQTNARNLELDLQFQHGSWLQQVPGRFDAIVSNPPYIAAQDHHLGALAHEPTQALSSGADGLHDIRQIIAQAPSRMLPNGWLLLEHGYNQALAVRTLLSEAGFEDVRSRHDLSGIERCSGARWRQR
ncbi:peptide chain release factor N(5)-glutamine methyltransferase [Rhodoferax sp.]|uniref:peptide chain release factor N(5)-glutamine methyltransferase n=1 Tax=Rhodoferax sp. TaxID=50421 RepID=UPI00274E2A99|nr:peptide chain release factor N(5)-glutamine methyltransferase [Rhodoferax sp.]